MDVPQIPPTQAMRFCVRLRTRWSDEDNQGVLNNAAFLTLLEEARHAYFGDLGLIEHNRFPFLLAQTNVSFLRPGAGGVEVEIEVRTTHLGTTSIIQAYRVREPATGAVWCEAEARLVSYDPLTRAKTPTSDVLRARVHAREGLGA
jgi:acyl-CoA thioester hydrolase